MILSNLAGPTSDVPGMAGAKFNPGTTSSSAFDRPYVSPDGSRWIVGGIIDGSVDLDALIVGTGDTSAGATVPVKEGDPVPGDASLVYSAIKTQVGINNAGAFAFAADTSAPTGFDDVVARWDGSSFDLVAREGTQAPGQPVGIGYGSTHDAVSIHDNADASFRSAGLTGDTTQQVLYRNSSITTGTVLAQTDVTTPAGQLVAPDQTLDVLNRFVSDSSGANTLYMGDLNGPTTSDLVIVHNGTVVAQEGAPLPGWSNTANVVSFSVDAGSLQISPANDHYLFRGSVNDGTGTTNQTDFVTRNGAVIAATGQPIFAGASELFDDTAFGATFFLNVVNSNGDYVIGGVTNNPDVNFDAVLVYNDALVIAREGDPVDVDGNGLFDDNAFIDVFGNDDGALTDDGTFYFVASLQDANNAPIGNAFMVVQVPEPVSASLLALGTLVLGLRRRTRA